MLNQSSRAEWLAGWAQGVAQVTSGKSAPAIEATLRQIPVSLGDSPWRAGYIAAMASALGF